MARYTLEYADGRVSDITADDDAAATHAARVRIGDDAVVAEQWITAEKNDDGEPCERLEIFSGADAVASLHVVRR